MGIAIDTLGKICTTYTEFFDIGQGIGITVGLEFNGGMGDLTADSSTVSEVLQ